MKDTINWVSAALASKSLDASMKYYRVADGEIKATDGRITACHPWPYEGEFLVPGKEFEKVLERCPGDLTITNVPRGITLRSGRFHGTINTLPLTEWDYPGVADSQWHGLPAQLLPILGALRPFASENAVHPWAMAVALQNGWAYASNNVALGGAQCRGLKGVQALLPVWAIDFLLDRTEGLTHWAWTDHYAAFKWKNGAWMRSILTVGVFPEKAAELIKAAFEIKPTQHISEEFRNSFRHLATVAIEKGGGDTVTIFKDRMESKYGHAHFVDGTECEVPDGGDKSIWGAKYVMPAIEVADSWSPGTWPQPTPFRGPLIAGYVVGRRV